MQTHLERLVPGSAEWTQHGLQHLQRYRFAAPQARGKRVLDLACGVGYGSYALRQMGAASVLGVDLDGEAIAYARAHYVASGLEYIVGNALLCDFKASGFELITSFETIEHLPDPALFLENAARLLVADGRLIVSAPNTLQYQRGNPPIENPYHVNEPDYDTLKMWLETRFHIEEEWEQSPVYPFSAQDIPEPPITDFTRLAALRLLRGIENGLRYVCGKSLPELPAARPPSGAMQFATELFPLLPERRKLANVFVMVCRKRERP